MVLVKSVEKGEAATATQKQATTAVKRSEKCSGETTASSSFLKGSSSY